jgi:hypothetical protein
MPRYDEMTSTGSHTELSSFRKIRLRDSKLQVLLVSLTHEMIPIPGFFVPSGFQTNLDFPNANKPLTYCSRMDTDDFRLHEQMDGSRVSNMDFPSDHLLTGLPISRMPKSRWPHLSSELSSSCSRSLNSVQLLVNPTADGYSM